MSEKVLWICPECDQPQYQLSRCAECDYSDLQSAVGRKVQTARVETHKSNKKTWTLNLVGWGGILILVWATVDGGYSRYFKSAPSPAGSPTAVSTDPTPSPTPRALTDEEFHAFTAMNAFAEKEFAGWKLEGSTLNVTDADTDDHILIYMDFSKGNENRTVPVILEKFNVYLDEPSYWKAFRTTLESSDKTPKP